MKMYSNMFNWSADVKSAGIAVYTPVCPRDLEGSRHSRKSKA